MLKFIVLLVGMLSVDGIWGKSLKVPQSLNNKDVRQYLTAVAEDLVYSIHRDGSILQEFVLNGGHSNAENLVSKMEDHDDLTLMRVQRTLQNGQVARDCIQLNSKSTSWYGGPQQKRQYWPIEKLMFNDYSYVTKEADNCGIAERYWLSSKGVFIFIDDDVPLFIDQNAANSYDQVCFVAKMEFPYDTTAATFDFSYYIGVAKDARVAHRKAVERFLGKPSGHPDERMVRDPIWSTWARYKRDINEAVVLEFADEITANNFTNSQLEIDDDWEICYGALTFRDSKFLNVKTLTQTLRDKGFRTSLWVHPFINVACTSYFDDALSLGYLVKNSSGAVLTQWWNSVHEDAAYVDFSNPDAAAWFVKRLKDLLDNSDIDSFKFDAGESSWTPNDPILTGSRKYWPQKITTDYVRAVAQFGDMVEVRSGWRTQDLPIFVRMIDKDSTWTWNNGLPTLVTTLLQMNMNGYPLVLPDMIGGNGYDDSPPNKEMLIRWTQANVFMPSLQYSYVPWEERFDAETITICRHFTQLHSRYTPAIMERFRLAVTKGEPVNPPLWWIAPDDRVAQQIYDQFLLGEDIIAAPVLAPGKTSRNVYLPAGRWRDGNSDTVHQGPKWILQYNAPLDVLPYFIRA